MSVAETVTLSNMELSRVFIALGLLLLAAHFLGYLFQKIRLPRVIGEIFGGALLGPSFLGHLFPQAHQWIFGAFDGEGKLISIVYWFGLVLLMFISGFELQKSFDQKDGKLIVVTLLGSTIIPFLAGWLAPSFYDFTPYLGPASNMLSARIIIGITVAITSIPVISRIFIDLGVNNTSFAKVVLTTATLHDVVLWVALAIATGLVSASSLSAVEIASRVLITIAFFGLAIFVLPKFTEIINGFRFNLLIKSSTSGYLIVICLLFSSLASALNVNIVFGAFLAGIVVGAMPQERFRAAKEQIRDISLAFFVPIYFAVIGLKLDLIHQFDLRFFLGFALFATAAQTIGTLLALKLARVDWLSSFNMAVAMNARGGPGIVLATIAFDLGIINQALFVTFILLALVTSLAAGSWFRYVTSKGWPLLKNQAIESDNLIARDGRETLPLINPHPGEHGDERLTVKLVDKHRLGAVECTNIDFRNREKRNHMHIELIGSTSAGKTTLAKKMVEAGIRTGTPVSLSDDFMLDQMRLNWIGNDFIRRRLVEMVAFAITLTRLSKFQEFIDFVITEGRNSPGSWLYRVNRIRNVIRKIGIFEFISRRAGSRQVVLADNEGLLQGVHNLFVHQDGHADLGKIARYVELVPLPDVVLYLKPDEAVLISRTLARGHGRVKSEQPDVAHFIRQAVGVFDEMANLPALRRKLLIVNGELNVEYNGGGPEAAFCLQALELVKNR